MDADAKSPTDTIARPSTSEPAPSGRLKFIRTTLSRDGRHIQLHFITDQDNVTTVQLEASVATMLHVRLGDALMKLTHPETHPDYSRRSHLH